MINELYVDAEKVIEGYRDQGWLVATAESCTGGLLAGQLTAIPRSSKVFERGFVTYSNDAKQDLLGVPASLIKEKGAVSAEVAEAMAAGALARSKADVTIAVTGIAGPGGGSAEKPLGLVYLARAMKSGGVVHERHVFEGDRTNVRKASVIRGLELLLEALS